MLDRLPGRLRALRHFLLLIPLAMAAWIWLGLTGAVPVVLLWWLRRPSPAGTACWLVDLGRVRSARLGPWRTSIRCPGQPAIEIFRDELSGPDLARLRRALKSQLAAG